MGENRATVEITASSRKLDEDLRAARRKWQTWAKGVGRDLDSVTSELRAHREKAEREDKRRGGGAGASFIGNFGADIARRGLDQVVDAGKSTLDYERAMTRLQIAANRAPEEMNAFRESVTAASRETGIGRDEIIGAAQTYVSLTGDMAGAEAQAREFARVAQASGASIQDVATAGVAMKEALKVDPSDLDAAFSSMIVQGKAGAVELKDVAAELASVAPQFASFKGGTGLDGLRQMGATLQIVRKEFKGSAETATGLRALMTSITQNASKFKGVKMFEKGADGVKRLRNLHDIVIAISNSRLAKDPTKLTKAFGSSEAMRAYQALATNAGLYDEIYKAASDTDAVTRDFNTYMASSSGSIEKSWNDIKVTIAEIFTPDRIRAFADGVEALAHGVEAVVGKIEGMFSTASGMARELRRMMGMETDDEKVARLERQRLDRRRNTLAVRAALRGVGGFDQEDADKIILREDQIANNVRKGLRDDGVGGSYRVNELAKIAMTARRADFTNAGTLATYDVPYAIRNRIGYDTRQVTNAFSAGAVQSSLSAARAAGGDARVVAALEKLAAAIMQQPIGVNIDGHKAAAAVRAGQPRTRPGG